MTGRRGTEWDSEQWEQFGALKHRVLVLEEERRNDKRRNWWAISTVVALLMSNFFHNVPAILKLIGGLAK